MIRTFLQTMLLLVAVYPAHACCQPPQITCWTGKLQAAGRQLRLEISVVDDDGRLTGELLSLDQNNARLELADIVIDEEVLEFTIPQIRAHFRGSIAANGRTAAGTFRQSGQELPLKLHRSESRERHPDAVASQKTTDKAGEVLREAWYGKLQMGVVEPVMQFRIVRRPDGEVVAYFDSVTEGRTGFSASWSMEGDRLTFDVPAIKLGYRGQLNESRDSAEGTWSQGGRNLPLTLTRHDTEYRSANVWKNRPQRPVAPFPYDSEEVTFENQQDAVTLAGTLTIPRTETPGRHPAVILISGSGPQDRDQSLMEHKPFLVLADYLSRRGIAVLRYDDRGTASSTGDFGQATTEDFARDAAAAVEYLKHHPRINPREIGLAGHSEGGLVAPMVASTGDDVAFVVLLAATGVDGATIVKSQTEALLRATETAESEIELALKINRVAIDLAVQATSDTEFSDQLDQAVDAILGDLPESVRASEGDTIRQAIDGAKQRLRGKWMRIFLTDDPRPALSGLDCPVLAIIGSKDLQVLPDLNVPAIRAALEQGGNPDFEMVELPGLNHLFQKCETGAISEYITIQETVNPAALEKIGQWIIERTTPVE